MGRNRIELADAILEEFGGPAALARTLKEEFDSIQTRGHTNRIQLLKSAISLAERGSAEMDDDIDDIEELKRRKRELEAEEGLEGDEGE